MCSHLRFLVGAVVLFITGCAAPPAGVAAQPGDRIPAEKGDILVYPIEHASLVLQWNEKTIYVDPVGGAKRYAQLPKPDVVLVTHEHFDHFDVPTLEGLISPASKAKIVAPKSVADKLPSGSLADRATVVSPGDKIEAAGIPVEAVPAYNLSPRRQEFHPKGRDVGYVIQLGGKRIYVAGDTEDIPEMRNLKDIDAAFLPMNLPYTMDVERAANAVRAMKPKIVYPYHFRSRDKTTPDFDKLKKLIGADGGAEVRVLKWY